MTARNSRSIAKAAEPLPFVGHLTPAVRDLEAFVSRVQTVICNLSSVICHLSSGEDMLKDILGQAWEAMVYNRRRTAITMVGMAWGIATVVLLVAYGAGFSAAIERFFQVGTNSIIFWVGEPASRQAAIRLERNPLHARRH